MQQIDAMMHSRLANLAYAFYGRRDMQEQCGAGSHTNSRTIGADTMLRGMQDTVGYEYAKVINPNVTNSLIDNLVHQYAWFIDTDTFGTKTVTQVNNICCLGYVNLYGHKYEMMDWVDLPNDTGNVGKVAYMDARRRCPLCQGHDRLRQLDYRDCSWSIHGYDPCRQFQRQFLNVFLRHLLDKHFNRPCGLSRRPLRANASGGVSYAYAFNDASYASTNVGSRLAFRGLIVKAQSVAAYKALSEAA